MEQLQGCLIIAGVFMGMSMTVSAELTQLANSTGTEPAEEGVFHHLPAMLNQLKDELELKVNTHRMELLLRNVFSFPRNHLTNSSLKDDVRKFLARTLASYKMLTTYQQFQPVHFHESYPEDMPDGTNIVSILPGRFWGTKKDRILVVGAHWDTLTFTPGTDDNGSGVTALLESARVLAKSPNRCRRDYSILFVAFDLEESGGQGSLAFVRHHLVPRILRPFGWPAFQGAFILDTVLNWNSSKGSQEIPDDWKFLTPDLVSSTEREGHVGDFVAVFYRPKLEAERNGLQEVFRNHWTQVSGGALEMRYKGVPLTQLTPDMPPVPVLSRHLDFLRSDHARFWYLNDSSMPFNTLPAVLITDTGPYRGVMKECYHNVCDGPQYLLDNKTHNMEFLGLVTQALVDTLAQLSHHRCFDGETVAASSAVKPNPLEVLFRSWTILKWMGVV